MKSIDGRLRKLEDRFGLVENKPRFVLMLDGAGSKRALSNDDCIQILDEAEFLPPSGSCIVDFTVIPHGLNAKEEERFVRENGAQLCGSRLAQSPGGRGDGGVTPIRRAPEITVELS
jgi:hypothetical protein